MPFDFTVSTLPAQEAEIVGFAYPVPAPTDVERSGKFPAGQPAGAALVVAGNPTTVNAIAESTRPPIPALAITSFFMRILSPS